MITITRENIDSLVLYEAMVLAWLVFLQILQITPDWITVGATILYLFLVSQLILKDPPWNSILPLNVIFLLFFVFRIDQMIMGTFLIEILTRLTAYCLLQILNYGSLIIYISLIGIFVLFQSQERIKSTNFRRDRSMENDLDIPYNIWIQGFSLYTPNIHYWILFRCLRTDDISR